MLLEPPGKAFMQRGGEGWDGKKGQTNQKLISILPRCKIQSGVIFFSYIQLYTHKTYPTYHQSRFCICPVSLFPVQKKDASTGFHALRVAIMKQLKTVLPPSGSNLIREDKVVEACSFIKLYCAMKSIAAMRYSLNLNCGSLLLLKLPKLPGTLK